MSSTDAPAPQQLSRSPSKWIEELEASPSLLTSATSSAIIYKGLSMANAPILQKRLYQIVKSHVAEMIACAPGCEILSGLLRFGTVKTAANVIKYIVDSAEFKALVATAGGAAASESASPKPTGKGKKAAAAAVAATSATSSSAVIDLDVINNFAPLISAVAYRVDVDPERNMILEPACNFILAAIKQQLGSALILPAEGGVTSIALALVGEKSGVVGDKFAAALIKDKPFLDYVLQLTNQQDKLVVGIVAKLVAAAKDSVVTSADGKTTTINAERANTLASGLWQAAQQKFSAEAKVIRMSFMIALIPHQANAPVVNDMAKFVATKRSDILESCLTSNAPTKSEIAALLLNLAGPEESKLLARGIIASVQDWPALMSKPQLPQLTLGCFMALNQVVQRFSNDLLPRDKDTADAMKTVLAAATRHFFKQTLTAAESAKIAVKLRLSEQQQNNQQEKPKLLKVVDSSDDDDNDDQGKNSKNVAAAKASPKKLAGTRRGRDGEEEQEQASKPSPKNSAKKVAKK